MADIIPQFTKEHIAWLEKVFPEQVHEPKSPYDLYTRLGARQVVNHIKKVHEDQLKRIAK